nr:uracil-DNA glycosylase [Marinicella sp. W31]MDC2876596.1 uracil-DNA glycosylase [Marinicella sp. W31]
MNGFSGCNLKHNARSTIALDTLPESGILAICGFPTGDDDRYGAPLAGRAGGLFERMLAAIGLTREAVAVTTAIPWRTPGDRSPTLSEMDICRPFIERQIALAEPRILLVLGNFASRMLIDGTKTVFDLRGKWHTREIDGHSVEALVTFSPTELLAAPANKKPAWHDLLAFKARLD